MSKKFPLNIICIKSNFNVLARIYICWPKEKDMILNNTQRNPDGNYAVKYLAFLFKNPIQNCN